jgi:hypothetical protein
VGSSQKYWQWVRAIVSDGREAMAKAWANIAELMTMSLTTQIKN